MVGHRRNEHAKDADKIGVAVREADRVFDGVQDMKSVLPGVENLAPPADLSQDGLVTLEGYKIRRLSARASVAIGNSASKMARLR